MRYVPGAVVLIAGENVCFKRLALGSEIPPEPRPGLNALYKKVEHEFTLLGVTQDCGAGRRLLLPVQDGLPRLRGAL